MARELTLGHLHLLLQLRNAVVTNFRRLRQLTGACHLLDFNSRRFDFLLDATNGAECVFFLLPLRAHGLRPFLLVGELAFDDGATFDTCHVRLFAQRLTFDFKLDNVTLDFIDFLWQRIDFDAQA